MCSWEEAVLWGQWDLHFFFTAREAETGYLTLSPTKCHWGPAMYSSLLFYATSLMCLYNKQHVVSAKAAQMRSNWFSFFDVCCFFPSAALKEISQDKEHLKSQSLAPWESTRRQCWYSSLAEQILTRQWQSTDLENWGCISTLLPRHCSLTHSPQPCWSDA